MNNQNNEQNVLDNDPIVENVVNQSERVGSGVANNNRKSGNKKLGFLVILVGLFAMLLVASPQLLKMLKSDEEDKPVEQEVKRVTAYKPPEQVEEKPTPKTFTFDEVEEEKPIERIGDPVPQEKEAPPKLIKSLTGEMMNKLGNTSLSSVDSYAEAEDKDQQAVNKAIAQAQGYLNEQDEPSEKIESGSQGDIFNAPIFQPSVARKSRYNPNLLLEQGTLIPCALRVRVISNVSGNISCTITENVYSSNGNVLLIDKGSRVNGYYQGGSVNHGSKQLFVVWQEVRTPDNLVIPLNSGSTDELGANGLNGWVDNHFWERFSNAIFLSMILDGNNILMSKISDQAQTNTENTREAGKEIATTVLEQMGDIKPTLL